MKAALTSDTKAKQVIIADLLRWYQGSARPLPWRNQVKGQAPDPYLIWISEIMAQQSTIAMMLPYYERWVQKFPTLEKLAKASPAAVLSAWAGLGYYSRARNIHKTAQGLVQFRKTHGRWPERAAEWLTFDGVGPYTASAIAAICFDEPVLPLDGNVYRVLSRLYDIKDPFGCKADHLLLRRHLDLLASQVPRAKRGTMAQALMELGATICKPLSRAQCEICPLQDKCLAFALGRVSRLPAPKKRAQMKELLVVSPVYKSGCGTQILLRKIPSTKRLAGQWELPGLEIDLKNNKQIQEFKVAFEVLGPIRHTITKHRYLHFVAIAGRWGSRALPKGHAFFSPREIMVQQFGDLPTFTSATRKLMNFLVA